MDQSNGRISCPVCLRKFSQSAASRHIPACRRAKKTNLKSSENDISSIQRGVNKEIDEKTQKRDTKKRRNNET